MTDTPEKPQPTTDDLLKALAAGHIILPMSVDLFCAFVDDFVKKYQAQCPKTKKEKGE